MIETVRRAAAATLFALALAVPVAAQDELGLASQSSVGNYLAGLEAFHDLRTADAAQFFKAAVVGDWTNPLIIERAFIAYAANGQVDESAGAARHLLDLNAQSDVARIVVATQQIKQRRFEAAIAELDKVGSDSFEGVSGTILKAWALVGENKSTEAFTELDKLAHGGLEDFVVFHRALMAEVAGRQDDAIKFAAKAYDADPTTERVVEAYARLLGNAGRFDEAIGVIVNFEAQGLSHPMLDSVKTALSSRQRPGPFADSVSVGAAEMFHAIGVALAQEGNIDVAIVYMRLALYLSPNADVMSMFLAQIYDSAGRNETANAIYEAIPAGSPLKPAAVVRVADNLDALGNRSEAIRRLSNIVTSNPDDLDAVSVLGDLLRADKHFAEAADAYTKALALTPGDRPGDWRFYYVRGIAYERNNQWNKAEADFLKALDLNTDQPQVLNYLGYSWVDQGTHLDQALAMIKKAVAASPNDGYIIDSLGWAYYRLGRFDDAVAELEQAVALRPNDAEINDHLGDAYREAGRTLEATFQWNVAAAVDMEGAVKDRVAAKFAALAKVSAPTPEPEPVPPIKVADGDAAGADGQPASDAPQAVTQPDATQSVTVKAGDSLWTIARGLYGNGADYGRIVDANRAILGNPDVIHPGLVLVLPQAK